MTFLSEMAGRKKERDDDTYHMQCRNVLAPIDLSSTLQQCSVAENISNEKEN